MVKRISIVFLFCAGIMLSCISAVMLSACSPSENQKMNNGIYNLSDSSKNDYTALFNENKKSLSTVVNSENPTGSDTQTETSSIIDLYIFVRDGKIYIPWDAVICNILLRDMTVDELTELIFDLPSEGERLYLPESSSYFTVKNNALYLTFTYEDAETVFEFIEDIGYTVNSKRLKAPAAVHFDIENSSMDRGRNGILTWDALGQQINGYAPDTSIYIKRGEDDYEFIALYRNTLHFDNRIQRFYINSQLDKFNFTPGENTLMLVNEFPQGARLTFDTDGNSFNFEWSSPPAYFTFEYEQETLPIEIEVRQTDFNKAHSFAQIYNSVTDEPELSDIYLKLPGSDSFELLWYNATSLYLDDYGLQEGEFVIRAIPSTVLLNFSDGCLKKTDYAKTYDFKFDVVYRPAETPHDFSIENEKNRFVFLTCDPDDTLFSTYRVDIKKAGETEFVEYYDWSHRHIGLENLEEGTYTLRVYNIGDRIVIDGDIIYIYTESAPAEYTFTMQRTTVPAIQHSFSFTVNEYGYQCITYEIDSSLLAEEYSAWLERPMFIAELKKPDSDIFTYYQRGSGYGYEIIFFVVEDSLKDGFYTLKMYNWEMTQFVTIENNVITITAAEPAYFDFEIRDSILLPA